MSQLSEVQRKLQSGDMLHTRDGFDFEVYNAYMDFGLGWNPKAWEQIEQILGSLATAVQGKGSKLAVALFPVHIQVLGTVIDTRPQENARAMCARLGIPFLDTVPVLRADAAGNNGTLYFDHCHYTAHGFKVLATETVRWLEEAKLIPPA